MVDFCRLGHITYNSIQYIIHSMFILKLTGPDFLVVVFVAYQHAGSLFPAVAVSILKIIASGHRWCSGIQEHVQDTWIRSNTNIHPTVMIVALTGHPIGYSVIVALTGLPIGYSVIVALTGLPIGYSVIVDTV